jgi:hypothetical protein
MMMGCFMKHKPTTEGMQNTVGFNQFFFVVTAIVIASPMAAELRIAPLGSACGHSPLHK